MATHPLCSGFSFWFLKRVPNMLDEDYFKNMIKLGTFDTVEGFWSYYNFLTRPDDMRVAGDSFLFRVGIKPLWEDPANRDGGKWMVRVKRGNASRCWESLVLAIIGNQEGLGRDICGAVCSVKFQDTVISVWNANSGDEAAKIRIRDALRNALGVPASVAIEYRAHKARAEKSQRPHGTHERAESEEEKAAGGDSEAAAAH